MIVISTGTRASAWSGEIPVVVATGHRGLTPVRKRFLDAAAAPLRSK
jgi:hypothetical protein